MPWNAHNQKSRSAQRKDAWKTESNMLGTQLSTKKFSGNNGSATGKQILNKINLSLIRSVIENNSVPAQG